MRHLVLSGLLYGSLAAIATAQQMPGDFPRLFLDDGHGNQAPTASGPFDNTAVFEAASGLSFAARLEYLSEGPSNEVPWGLLVSLAATPFAPALPPPLFTMPPFVFVAPTPLLLDASGQGSIPLAVPEGMLDGTLFFQAIVRDVDSTPVLKLSDGVTLQIVPPAFNVRFSAAARTPAIVPAGFGGLATVDRDAETLAGIAPLGSGGAPTLEYDDTLGLLPGFRFLPILPNTGDAPTNPLARPVTRLTADMTNSLAITVFPVVDTTGFPSQGTIFVARQGVNPYGERPSAAQVPDVEAVLYTGKTPTSFIGCTRKVLGSTGNANFPHLTNDIVLGEFSMVTTSGAVARNRVSLDARNADMPHVVVPAVTFDGGEGVGEVTLDHDLYLYSDDAAGVQGFLVLDRVTQTWRVLSGTEIPISSGAFWDPMIHVTPDRRAFLAIKRTFDGADFPSSQDELWAIRLDGLDWPASGAPTWNVAWQLTTEPVTGDTFVPSRRLYMPFVRVVGPDPDNSVAFVGAAYKWAQSSSGDGVVAAKGYEGFWVREETIVSDVFTVPLVPPGSSKAPPAEPRPFISSSFPTTGDGSTVIRFDPFTMLSKDGRTLVMTAGATETNEDVYTVRNVTITNAGAASYQLLNVSGLGFPGGANPPTGQIRGFYPGGDGFSQRGSISPDGTRVMWLYATNTSRDYLMTAKTNGSTYALATKIYEDPNTLKFKIPGEYTQDHTIRGVHLVDSDRVYFLMGLQKYNDPFAFDTPNNLPQMDVFRYTVSTNKMDVVTNTSPVAGAFAEIGTISPLTTFLGDDGKILYVVRGGKRCLSGCTGASPVKIDVVDVFAVATASGTVFDVTGDEFGIGSEIVDDTFVPSAEILGGPEGVAPMEFVEGGGVQAGMMYFRAHLQADSGATDEVFAFNLASPSLAFAVTSGSGAGTHVSNISPDPYGGRVVFARTAGTNRLAADQHAFAVDLEAFLFERDITSAFTVGGSPIGRLMDGSFQFVPPDASTGAGAALVFSFGVSADVDTGLAVSSVPLYYPLANVSDVLTEPDPLLVPLIDVVPLGPNFRTYVTSAGLSTADP